MFWSNIVEGINEIVVEKYWIIVNLFFSARYCSIFNLAGYVGNEMMDDWFWLVFF